METFLMVLLVVGGLVYKIYENYQEEMEKARKRQKQLRPTATTVPAPTPVHNQKLGRPKPQKIVISEQSKQKELSREESKPRYETELPPEVIRLRRERLEREQLKKIELEEVGAVDEPGTQNIQFDLKQAVIQSIILERPYKY